MKLLIASIRADGGTQPRARTDREAVSEYAEAMTSGAKFPPVVVFFDGSEYWLADGFHRRDAAIQAGLDEIGAEVKQGTQRDAVLYSVGANSTHGRPRSDEDKRRSVYRLLEDSEWSRMPQREIAKACKVSREYVNRVSQEIPSCDRSQDKTRIVERDGTTYTQDTSRIGRTPRPVDRAEPVAEAPEPREYRPTGKPAAVPISHVAAKRSAAYESIETFLDTLDAVKRADEIAAMKIWLDNL